MRLDAFGRFWAHAASPPASVRKRIREVLCWFQDTTRIFDDEVNRLQKRLIDDEWLEYQDPHLRAWGFLSWMAMGTGPAARRDEVRAIRSVTGAEVRAAAARWLSPDHLVVVVTGPRWATAEDGTSVDVREELSAVRFLGR
jgi:predicted Zn-dependent peptidase